MAQGAAAAGGAGPVKTAPAESASAEVVFAEAASAEKDAEKGAERPRIALIWCMARNRVIGRDNDLPWHLPRDLRYFKETTLGHPIIMGRRTFDSIKKALPRRTNIVVTRNPAFAAPNVLVATDLDQAIALARQAPAAITGSAGSAGSAGSPGSAVSGADQTIFIVGGAEIYRLGLEVATHLHVTLIDADFDGDTFFPEVDWSRWRPVEQQAFPVDDAHAWPFTITVYERAAAGE